MAGQRRKRLRLPRFDYRAGTYFVTICALRRECVFGDVVDDEVRLSPVGLVAAACWEAIPAHADHVELDAFVVMPNHVHGILHFVGAGYIRPLPSVLATYKAAVSRRVGRPVWQRGYFERVVRNESELQTLRDYVAANPVNWALDRENPRSAPRRGGGPPG
jgi:putative transposase